MNTVTVAVVGLAVLASGAFVAFEALESTECRGPDVGSQKPTPDANHVRLTLSNPGEADRIRVCMFGADGQKLFDQTFEIGGTPALYWDLHLDGPVHRWVIDRAGGEGMDLGPLDFYGSDVSCTSRYLEFVYEDDPDGGGLISSDCGEGGNYIPVRQPGRQDVRHAAVMPDTDEVVGGGGAFALTLSLGGIVLMVVKFRTSLHWALIGLFTRIVAPKVLDQNVRAQIHQLVTQEPGIRPVEIAQRLELAAGQTTHHLRVLVRAQALSQVRQGLAIHYFLRGTYPPARMQQLAALRTDSVRRLHRALSQHPGAALTTLANLGGLSKARASRLAKRLQHLGLARAERHGKHVRLYPSN